MYLVNHFYHLNFSILNGILWGKFENDYIPNQGEYFKILLADYFFFILRCTNSRPFELILTWSIDSASN